MTIELDGSTKKYPILMQSRQTVQYVAGASSSQQPVDRPFTAQPFALQHNAIMLLRQGGGGSFVTSGKRVKALGIKPGGCLVTLCHVYTLCHRRAVQRLLAVSIWPGVVLLSSVLVRCTIPTRIVNPMHAKLTTRCCLLLNNNQVTSSQSTWSCQTQSATASRRLRSACSS